MRSVTHRRAFGVVLASLAWASSGTAQKTFTIEEALSAPFATEMVASSKGGKLAWSQTLFGVRNVWIAEPPNYAARQLTHYTADDGKLLGKLAFTPDARSLLYVRGGAHTGRIIPDPPNPAFDPAGGKEDIWIIATAGGEPSRIDDGIWPEVSPRGDLVAYLKGDEIWAAPLTASATGAVAGTPRRLFYDRGRAAPQGNVTSLRWSPTANRLAFISLRDQHSFIGVYDADANTIVFLDPSTDRDQWPEWSPDGASIAFVREPSQPQRAAPTLSATQLSGSGTRAVTLPWSIRVADAKTGKGREVWRAADGPGSAFWLGFMNNEHQLFWGADDRIAFPWERTGFMHMYSVSAAGGAAIELTPGGEFEVEHVALAPNGRDLVFMSNQGDTDRRHLWRVSIAGVAPQSVTTGKGIEYWPVFTSDGAAFAFLATTARTPPQVELLHMRDVTNGRRPANPAARQVLAPGITPKQFPSAALVEPRQVIWPSLDGVQVHGQLYLPPDYKAGERYPALVFLHGGPNMQQLLGYHYHRLEYYQKMYGMNQYLANHGYIVMSVNYRRGIGYGLNFREPESPVAASPREDPDVIDIVAAGLYLKGRPDVDPNRVGIWGGSAGGSRTILGLTFGSDVFVAGVDFHGVATQVLGKTQSWKAPVLIVHGDDDRNVPINLSVSLAAELRQRGVDVEEMILPNEGHSFFQHSTWLRVFQATDDFFARKLKSRATAARSAGAR